MNRGNLIEILKKKIKKDSFGDKESRNIEPGADVCRCLFHLV